MAPFVSGSTSEQIPFVFLPLKGQIIHPSKEINFAGNEPSTEFTLEQDDTLWTFPLSGDLIICSLDHLPFAYEQYDGMNKFYKS